MISTSVLAHSDFELRWAEVASLNGGVSAALYCFAWLYFSAAGAGPWSLDAKRGK